MCSVSGVAGAGGWCKKAVVANVENELRAVAELALDVKGRAEQVRRLLGNVKAEPGAGATGVEAADKWLEQPLLQVLVHPRPLVADLDAAAPERIFPRLRQQAPGAQNHLSAVGVLHAVVDRVLEHQREHLAIGDDAQIRSVDLDLDVLLHAAHLSADGPALLVQELG